VACGVWRVACGVWRVACGVWRVACGVWRVARACVRDSHSFARSAASAKEKVKEWEEEVKHLKGERERQIGVEVRLEVKEEENCKLSAECERLETVVAEHEHAKVRLAKEKEEGDRDRDGAFGRRESDLRREIATVTEKAERKIKQLKGAFEEVAVRAGRDKAVKDKAVASGKEAAALVGSMRKEIRRLKEKMEREVGEDKEVLERRVLELEESVGREKEKISMLESVLEEVKVKQSGVSVGVKVKDATIEQQQREIERMSVIIDNMGKDSGVFKEDLARIRGERGELEDEVEEKESEIEALEVSGRHTRTSKRGAKRAELRELFDRPACHAEPVARRVL